MAYIPERFLQRNVESAGLSTKRCNCKDAMSLLLKILEGIGVVSLIVCSICVTIVALYRPKNPEGKTEPLDDDSQ